MFFRTTSYWEINVKVLKWQFLNESIGKSRMRVSKWVLFCEIFALKLISKHGVCVCVYVEIKNVSIGTSLTVQWLGLHASIVLWSGN